MSRASHMQPERCFAGNFFGGTYGIDGSNKRTGKLAGIQIIPTVTTADTATELELRDLDWTNTAIVDSKKIQLVHIKKNADDGESGIIPIDPPIKFNTGIEVKTNTNCRVALYVV